MGWLWGGFLGWGGGSGRKIRYPFVGGLLGLADVQLLSSEGARSGLTELELDETGFVSGPWKIKGAADAHPSAVLRIMPGEDGQWQFVVARPRDVPSFDAVASGAAAPVTPEEEVPTAYDDLRLEREDALKELTDEYDVPDVDLY